jgi:poly-gamma-glutamate capsule biosynthesis protein CapA/YwtB (metallophosphatase superfamily)
VWPKSAGVSSALLRAACALLPAASALLLVVGCHAAPTAPQPSDAPYACAADDPARVGELRYALVAPLYTPTESITAQELAAMRAGTSKRTLAISDDGTDLELTATRWALVPADALTPAWQVVRIDGKHPLTDDTALVQPMCSRSRVPVRNIDRDALTTVTMTGVTAMTRFTALLMDKKGVTYPARDVAPWLAQSDFVHVSNEVSFVSTCEPKGENTEPFCSRDSYIELLAALHVNIVEVTGDHLADFGTRWLTRTLDMYDARGWKTFGGGRNQVEAAEPLLVEHHGNKLAFIGCNMPRSRKETIRNGPENAFCDAKRVDWQVADLRSRGYLPIVSLQHDEVRGHDPPTQLVRDFRRLAERGAAVVFGSQAHVAHPFEVHAGAYLHYGAGNFIFDQPWDSTRDGTVDRFYFHRGRLLTVERLFTRIEEQGRPRPMTDHERSTFLHTLSESLATLPPAKPALAPAVALERHTPDSFLVGNEPVWLRIAKPAVDKAPYPLVIDLSARGRAADDAFTVTLRKWPPLGRKRLVRAITEFMAAKYPIDRQRITIR